MKSDLQIAQEAKLKPITQIAREAGINEVVKCALWPGLPSVRAFMQVDLDENGQVVRLF